MTADIENMTGREYLDLESARTGYEEARSALETARGVVELARKAASAAVLSTRDLEFLVSQGVLANTDPQVQMARAKAAPSVQRLRSAEHELARVEYAADLAGRRLRRAEYEADQERRAEWVRSNRPEVASALDKAEEEYGEHQDQLRDFPADPYSPDGRRRMEIAEAAGQRAAEARRAFEQAMLEAPPMEGET